MFIKQNKLQNFSLLFHDWKLFNAYYLIIICIEYYIYSNARNCKVIEFLSCWKTSKVEFNSFCSLKRTKLKSYFYKECLLIYTITWLCRCKKAKIIEYFLPVIILYLLFDKYLDAFWKLAALSNIRKMCFQVSSFILNETLRVMVMIFSYKKERLHCNHSLCILTLNNNLLSYLAPQSRADAAVSRKCLKD